ncbi:MAG: AAA domain-containing protein, partial [Pseudomonadota bacterium]
ERLEAEQTSEDAERDKALRGIRREQEEIQRGIERALGELKELDEQSRRRSGGFLGFLSDWGVERKREELRRQVKNLRAQLQRRVDKARDHEAERARQASARGRRLSSHAVRLHEAEATVERLAAVVRAAAREAGLPENWGSAEIDRALEAIRQHQQGLSGTRRCQELWDEQRTEILASQEQKRQLRDELGSALVGNANLVCSTTTGIAGSPIARDVDFDVLIVDEASRVTDSEFLIGAVRARRWILVGDEHQLPPYVEQNDEHLLHAMLALSRGEAEAGQELDTIVSELGRLWEEDEELHQFRVNSVLEFAGDLQTHHWGRWARAASEELRGQAGHGAQGERDILQTMRDYLVHSLFERCIWVLAERPGLRQRLEEQRRMIPPIAEIVSEPVYGGRYRTPADLAIRPLRTPTFTHPVTFLDTAAQGPRAAEILVGNGFVNKLEQDWVVEACRTLDRELSGSGEPVQSISILCFYRRQALELRQRLGAPHFKRFKKLRFEVIDAIDKIQGQESDIVILSFCRTSGALLTRSVLSPKRPNLNSLFGKWLQDVRRLNVACTRAHRMLLLVGHRPTLAHLGGASDKGMHGRARRFYKHLLERFEAHGDEMQVVSDFGERRAS